MSRFSAFVFYEAKFDSIVQSILRWTDADFKFNDVVTALVAEETRLELRDRDHHNVYAEAQSIQYQRNVQYQGNKKKQTCFYC